MVHKMYEWVDFMKQREGKLTLNYRYKRVTKIELQTLEFVIISNSLRF
jgi:hypothetical protein